MRLHLILPFFSFLLRKTFSGVFSLNRKYRREMEHNPGLAIFLGTICSVLFVAVSSILGALLLTDFMSIRYVFMSAITLAVSYVVYTFFSIQFNNFLEERQELFDVIKDDSKISGRRY